MYKAHCMNSEDLLRSLGTGSEHGLAEKDITMLQNIYGKNILREIKSDPCWKLLLNQFKTAMIYLLAFASLISLLMGEKLDTSAILVVIFLNAFVAFLTEFRAERSLQALKSMTSPESKVIWSGKTLIVKSEDLVPGDIILLEAGDIVPADARILIFKNLMVNEASLTGESLPVVKTDQILEENTPFSDRHNCFYSGTCVVRGRAKCVIFATGMDTEFGKIGEMLQTVSSRMTPLEERLARFSHFMIFATVTIAILVILLGFLQGRGFLKMLETGIALALAAVPEGLPFVATMALAFEVHKMAGVNALVRNLSSVETLGSTTIICTDKTGTLTVNRMQIRAIETSCEEAMEKLMRVSVLCNYASLKEDNGTGDPIETALLRYAVEHQVSYEKVRREFPRINEEPFDSETRRMITWHTSGVAMKGAPEEIISQCIGTMEKDHLRKSDETIRAEWLGKVQKLASRGMRTLAFAWGNNLESMYFSGLAGFDDLPRKEVTSSVELCHKAGIHAVMVTGDHLFIAETIARETGIMDNSHRSAVSGEELNNMYESDIADIAGQIAVFARVDPEHKLKIVRGLQEAGEVVAMTGNGVNDAVALHHANVGVAMGIQGSEVSKEASDIILQDDIRGTIVQAVKEGRRIFDNIRKAVLFLLSCNLSEILTFFISILFRLPSVLLPLQILWINLATDVIPALAISLDPAEVDIMKRPPKKKSEDIITFQHKFQIVLYSILMAHGVLGFYLWTLFFHSGACSLANEMGFRTLVFSQLFLSLMSGRQVYSESRICCGRIPGFFGVLLYQCSFR